MGAEAARTGVSGGGLPNDWDRSGLPGWSYSSPGLLALEKEVLFRRHWQLVCHLSDLPQPGSYVTFDAVGERALVLRDGEGVVRAFHNVCRHRGSRVVTGEQGRCPGVMVCPFHGWSYNLDGTLRGAARPRTFPALDPVRHGLKPIDCEVWHGFVFIRFKPGPQPSVTTLMARHEAEIAPYALETLQPTAPFWTETTAVNWKAVRDVDNEGYHVAMAHPALHDLYGRGYVDEPLEDGTSRSIGPFNDGPGRLWSVRHYKKILPDAAHLPPSHRRCWIYIGLFPNTVFSLYPESVAFYQEVPLAPGLTLQRGAVYAWPGETRERRLARYLSARIERETVREDVQLTIWSSEAPASSGFEGIILSDLEHGVRRYHDALRGLMPVLNQAEEPGEATFRTLLEQARRADGPPFV